MPDQILQPESSLVGSTALRLAIVIPTYNRSRSLARTLDSVLRARVPSDLTFTIAAVDNRSNDDTAAVIRQYSKRTSGLVHYVPELRNQGRSFALNAGILGTESDLVAFIDDDEEVAPDWLERIAEMFRDPEVDYIGGRYLPIWESDPPAWVNHPHIRTAIGWADFGDRRRPFADAGFDALLMGGNSVLRRSCFAKVGLYSTDFGRKGTRLLAGEDSDMHDRLLRAGLHGLYLPDLIVYHHIPSSRVRRSYMRSWAFWAAASTGFHIRRQPAAGPRWFGLPRYMFTNGVRAQGRWLRSLLAKGDQAETFSYELALWRLSGTFYGRHFLPDPRVD